MKYKDFKKTYLFKDADIIIIQNHNKEILELTNYKHIRNLEILEYETNIDNELVVTTLTLDI